VQVTRSSDPASSVQVTRSSDPASLPIPFGVETRRRVRWPFLVALAVAVVALGVRYTFLAGGAGAGPVPNQGLTLLEGITGQGTKFELGIQNHRVYRLSTSLNARCRGGTSVHETWSPAEHAPVHFTIAGRTFTTVERGSPTYKDGVVGRIAFTIRGTVIGKGAAQGTIRLVARYYRGEREWNACDSLDVAWAVGSRPRARLRTVTLGKKISEYYRPYRASRSTPHPHAAVSSPASTGHAWPRTAGSGNSRARWLRAIETARTRR
jgi:hypothetical protein